MSDELLAWLWTIGAFVSLSAWVPFLELVRRLSRRAAAAQPVDHGSRQTI
jgi:hypothetical protein